MSTTTMTRPSLPLRAEIGRQLRRRRTIGIFIVLIVLPLVLLLAFWLGDDGNDSGQRGFVDLAQESGANLVIFTLRLDELSRLSSLPCRRRYRPPRPAGPVCATCLPPGRRERLAGRSLS